MKLFVDDVRECPSKGFEAAYDYDGAVMLLKAFGYAFDFIDLDYDLGDGKTGLDILKFLHENGKYPKHINIHSDHPEGKEEMRRYAEENFPAGTVITMNLIG